MKPFEQYLRLLLELFYLDGHGQFDSKRADEIRDEMDAPYFTMSVKEKFIMQDISDALYGKLALDNKKD